MAFPGGKFFLPVHLPKFQNLFFEPNLWNLNSFSIRGKPATLENVLIQSGDSFIECKPLKYTVGTYSRRWIIKPTGPNSAESDFTVQLKCRMGRGVLMSSEPLMHFPCRWMWSTEGIETFLPKKPQAMYKPFLPAVQTPVLTLWPFFLGASRHTFDPEVLIRSYVSSKHGKMSARGTSTVVPDPINEIASIKNLRLCIGVD